MVQAAELTGQKCVACRADSPRVTEEQIASFKPQVPEWDLLDDGGILKLCRVYRFKDFAGALAFTNRIGVIAEDEGHHPLISTEWGRATVWWWSHKIKGLHVNDFIMAAKTDGIFDEGDAR